jgi:hypothetical protein
VIAFCEIGRFQHVEIERVLDLAIGILRRELDVDDDRVLRVLRIELAIGLADDLLVGADVLEDVAAERRLLLRDLQLRDARVRRSCDSAPAALSATSEDCSL